MEPKNLDQRSVEFRRKILHMIEHVRRGHIGSALSIVEIIRVLYEEVLRLDPENPLWDDRDRFILSKGHGCLALYVALAESGFIRESELSKFCEFDSILGGHPQYGKAPGVEASTGSLGHGLSIGAGIALNGKIDKKDYRTFVLVGDGECDEGTIWEGAMCASKHKLNRLIVIVDYNKMQCYGRVSEVQELEPFVDKWRSFGFNVKEVDGHDTSALRNILKNTPFDAERPQVVICHTVTGKGIHSLEGHAPSHHKSRITDEEMEIFIKELEQC
jgi:transketolase